MPDHDKTPEPFALGQTRPGLKKIRPYWHAYRTSAKERWLGREMLELISSEFRDRSVEYYVRLAQAGNPRTEQRTAIRARGWRDHNQRQTGASRHYRQERRPDRVCESPWRRPSILTRSMRRNVVHRHEPPVTATPVRILHVDKEKEFIVVDKPGSIVRSSAISPAFDSSRRVQQPVHATGRYYKNSLVEILRHDHGIEKPHSVCAVTLAHNALLSSRQL